MCRMIGYSYRGVPEAVYNAQVHPNLVMLSIETLQRAFFAGINKFLISAFANPERRPLVEARMQTMVQTYRYAP
jgi:hypothetical protein